MADYYEQFSEEMAVPVDKVGAVNAFFEQVEKDYDDPQYDFFGGIEVGWDKAQPEDKPAVWIHADENFMDEELAYYVQGLLRAIDDPEDKPFVVSIAYTVSRPIAGEFGGRAVAFWKNADYWVDARQTVDEYIKFHDGRPE